ncbi:MAG: glycerate kinase [Erysipelotrichaceae bacterium]|nr:glycerate kinase [Erysipelotrichaceae bacterium]
MLSDAKKICLSAIESCLPDRAVKEALRQKKLAGDIYLVAVGKASFRMARAACEMLAIRKGIVISKYNHIPGKIDKVETYEAGHPVLDENSLKATGAVIEMCSDLKETDTVLFLLSGGASALFEKPLVSLEELQDISDQMLKKGLSIAEINTIRKKLSMVKGGRFARLCEPAKVCSIILSDVLSDSLDVIGSGPTADDTTDGKDALKIIEKYHLDIRKETLDLIAGSRNVKVGNCENTIIGSVKILVRNAMKEAEKLGYKAVLIDDGIDCEAKEAGDLLYQNILEHLHDKEDIALIMGGETTVKVKGKGLGGRNQELVLSQAKHLSGLDNVLIMSLGSDGTDGPTDAAGGYVDGNTLKMLQDANIDIDEVLEDNDSYHALKAIGALIKTGPTGTNVNDITIALISSSDSPVIN